MNKLKGVLDLFDKVSRLKKYFQIGLIVIEHWDMAKKKIKELDENLLE